MVDCKNIIILLGQLNTTQDLSTFWQAGNNIYSQTGFPTTCRELQRKATQEILQAPHRNILTTDFLGGLRERLSGREPDENVSEERVKANLCHGDLGQQHCSSGQLRCKQRRPPTDAASTQRLWVLITFTGTKGKRSEHFAPYALWKKAGRKFTNV